MDGLNAIGVTKTVAIGLLLIGTLIVGAAAYGDDAAQKEGMAVIPVVWDTETFYKRLVEQGGRADFVFEEDRPFKSCHASTLVEMADGSLLCAWFGGTAEKNPDVGIWWSRFTDGRWVPPTLAAKVSQTAHWNPVLFRDPKRGIFLFFKVGVNVPPWQTYWMHSNDDGKTWSAPGVLVQGDIGGRGPVKNKPIVLSDGAWLAPASTEMKGWKPFADRSEDGGNTWQRSADFIFDRKALHCVGGIQPTFWESPPGAVHALMRTASGFVARTDSHDGGRTWDPVSKTDLPNNNSGIDAVRLDDGRVFLIYNPVGRNWGPRSPLTLAVSTDNGATWKPLAHLETDRGEYSYPSIIQTRTGIAVCYTWKRERVRCWQIPLEALK